MWNNFNIYITNKVKIMPEVEETANTALEGAAEVIIDNPNNVNAMSALEALAEIFQSDIPRRRLLIETWAAPKELKKMVTVATDMFDAAKAVGSDAGVIAERAFAGLKRQLGKIFEYIGEKFNLPKLKAYGAQMIVSNNKKLSKLPKVGSHVEALKNKRVADKGQAR